MDERTSSQLLEGLSTATLYDAHPDVRAMHPSIGALFGGARVAGPACTVETPPGHNAAIHRALYRANEGEILVVDAGSDRSFGLFGDLLADGCRRKGVRGAVIDGSVRDSRGIRRMRFPVFCIGTSPAGTSKKEPGVTDRPIRCGGLEIEPGDYVVGDDDGVVVIPRELLGTVVKRAQEVESAESQIRSRLEKGSTTYHILGLANS